MVLDPRPGVDMDTLDRLSQHALLGTEGAYGAKAVHGLSEMAGGRVVGGWRRGEGEGRLDGFTSTTIYTTIHQIHQTHTLPT